MRHLFNSLAHLAVLAHHGVNDLSAYAETRLRGVPAATLENRLGMFQAQKDRFLNTLKTEDTDSTFYFALNLLRDDNDRKRKAPKNWQAFFANGRLALARTHIHFREDTKYAASLQRVADAFGRFAATYDQSDALTRRFIDQITHREGLWLHPENLASERYYHPGSAMDRWVNYLNGREPKKPELHF